MSEKELKSVTEYAKAKGVSPQRVRQLLMQGRLPGRRIGGRWVVEVEDETLKTPLLKHTKILTLFSHAGGVGKTTLARDLGYYFARSGYRTLLVDTDPQANLTYWLGLSDIEDNQTLYPLIMGDGLPDPIPVMPEATDLTLDIIPANLNLALLDFEIARQPRGDMILRRALSDLDRYDIIFIDSPPYISQTTTMAALAGQGFIVPVETSLKGLGALTGLVALAHKFAKALETDVKSWIRLLVPTKFDPRTTVDHDVIRHLTDLADQGYRVSAPISYRPGIHKRATMAGKPIPALFPLSKDTEEINVVGHILTTVLHEIETEASHA